MSPYALASLGVLCLFLRTLAVDHANVGAQCGDDDETCDSGLVMLQLGKQQHQVNSPLTAQSNETSKARVNESKAEGDSTLLDLSGYFTIQQKVNRRFLDAYTESEYNYKMVTRERQSDESDRPGSVHPSQLWILKSVGNDAYTIQQKLNNRYVDCYEGGNDHACFTHNPRLWIIKYVGGVTDLYYTIQQKSNNRFMDAHEDSNDYGVVTRDAQNDDSQKWILKKTAPLPSPSPTMETMEDDYYY